MTLIIARKFGDRIIVVNDTMISGKGLARPSLIPGQLKTIVIDDRVSISFAGTADIAIATIREARMLLVKKTDLSELIFFLKVHSASDESDFIVASHIALQQRTRSGTET
jgi:hypothetical protein